MTRLVLVVLAFAFAARAYVALSGPQESLPAAPLGWLALASILLILGLRHPVPAAPESRQHRGIRWGLGAVSAGLAWFGARLAPLPGRELESGLAWILAILCFLGARNQALDPAFIRRLALPATVKPTTRATVAIVAAAAAAALVATVVNRYDPRGGAVFWIAALVALGIGARLADAGRGVESRATSRRLPPRNTLIALVAAFTGAALLRLPYLADFPFLVNPDEGRLGTAAHKLWSAPAFPDLFDFGWNSFPNLGYTVQYALVPLAGMSYVALRLASAAVALLGMLPLTLWLRRWWGWGSALVGLLFVAVTHEHVYWSRVGFNNIHTAAIAAVVLATFAAALARGRLVDYVLFGFSIGAGFHTYHAAKSHGVLLVIPTLVLAATVPGFARRHARGALVAVFAFGLVVAPIVPNIYERFAEFRVDTTNRTDIHFLVDAYRNSDSQQVRSYLASHVQDSVLVFFSAPQVLHVFGPGLGVSFALGFVWMLWYWRDPRHTIVIGWIVVLLVLGSMTTDWPPNRARLVGLLPAAIAVVAVFVHRVLVLLCATVRRPGPVVAAALLFALTAGELLDTIDRHFVQLPRLQRADVDSFMMRTIRSQERPATVFMVGAIPGANPKIAMSTSLAPPPEHVTIVNLPFDGDVAPLPGDLQGDALIFVWQAQRDLVSLIRRSYPEAAETPIRGLDGSHLLDAFFVSAETLAAGRNLTAIARSTGAEAALPTPEIQPAYDESLGLRIAANHACPCRVEWRGQVWVPESGPVEWRARGGRVAAGWSTAAGDEAAEIAVASVAGWQPIRVFAELNDPEAGIPLEWRLPGSEAWTAVPRSALFRHAEPIGVHARYVSRTGEQETTHERLHPVIAMDWMRYDDDPVADWFPERSGSVTWSARVNLPAGRLHRVRLAATVPAELVVNDETLLAAAENGQLVREASFVAREATDIRILARTPDHHVEKWMVKLLWERPGGGWEALAPYRPLIPHDTATPGAGNAGASGDDTRGASTPLHP